MSIRSTTGCYTCKTRRKKCDETHPRCQRCIKSGIECGGYEYFKAKDGKLRTKPAPKPTSRIPTSVVQTSIPAHFQSATSSVPTTHGHLDSSDALQSSRAESLAWSLLTKPCDPIASVSFPQDTTWSASQRVLSITRQDPCAVQTGLSTFDLMIGHEAPSQSFSPGPLPSYGMEQLNPDQASLYRALFSLEHTQSKWSSADCFQSSPDPEASDEEDDKDPEGVRQTWVTTPVMDPSAVSNLVPFALQSYANWMMFVAFDPSQSAHSTKNLLVRQLADSESARRRIRLISEAMNAICETGQANPKATKMVSTLISSVQEAVLSYKSRPKEFVPDLDRQHALKVLDNVLEILSLQLRSAPLSSCLTLMESIAPIFRRACPEPSNTLVSLCDILVGPEMNLRNFVTTDVAFSLTIGRPMLFRYDVDFSIGLCERMKLQDKNFGLQWFHGIPDQFIVLIAWMNKIKEDSEVSGRPVDEETIARIEKDIKNLKIFTSDKQPEDLMLHVGRLVVQECWRQAVYVYLYMAMCGATSRDLRVEKAHKEFMRLANGVKPGRNPDFFLIVPWCTVGVATTKQRDRDTLRRRSYGVSECANPGTCANDGIRTLEDIWQRTASEGRPAVWDDKRIACYRICGM